MLTRRDLDGMTCQAKHDGEVCGNHGPLHFHAKCHPAAGTRASYAEGGLTIRCNACDRIIAVVSVAP